MTSHCAPTISLLFADNTEITASCENLDELYDVVNLELQKLCQLFPKKINSLYIQTKLNTYLFANTNHHMQ
jgi:hypothetical protein